MFHQATVVNFGKMTIKYVFIDCTRDTQELMLIYHKNGWLDGLEQHQTNT